MRMLYVILGSISMALGVIGIFLPLLPTTPFLLLTAALYLKGSPRLYNWLINQRCLGTYIRHFREHKAIPLRVKIVSVSLVWITILYGVFFVTDRLWLMILLPCMAAGISYHILSFRTLRRRNDDHRSI
ncbi:MAG: YbaN family protein [Mediterranea sp.]|jgi:uncharacterized membrane protein YbaN (DUF454 family)|nr:YbaN family protein [Mediterranea sp.]